MKNLIDRCRRLVGDPPREFSADEQLSFRLRLPLFDRLLTWLRIDKLRAIIDDLPLLRDRGIVVWGYIVQANEFLYRRGNRATLPANIIYSPDPFYDDHMEHLQGLAESLFDLKDGKPRDPELRKFAQAVSDETKRTVRLRLPHTVSNGRKIFFTTCYIQPSHLPNGFLAQGFFPVLICPRETAAVMVLPADYWPKELVKLWREGG